MLLTGQQRTSGWGFAPWTPWHVPLAPPQSSAALLSPILLLGGAPSNCSRPTLKGIRPWPGLSQVALLHFLPPQQEAEVCRHNRQQDRQAGTVSWGLSLGRCGPPAAEAATERALLPQLCRPTLMGDAAPHLARALATAGAAVAALAAAAGAGAAALAACLCTSRQASRGSEGWLLGTEVL